MYILFPTRKMTQEFGSVQQPLKAGIIYGPSTSKSRRPVT